MHRLISRHHMKSAAGKLYLVSHFRDDDGHRHMELSDGSPVEHVVGTLYRLAASGEIIREVGSETSLNESLIIDEDKQRPFPTKNSNLPNRH